MTQARIAIVDNGVHWDSLVGLPVDGMGDGCACWGHGTVMAAIVAQDAPGVRLISFRLGSDAQGALRAAEAVAQLILCAWAQPSVPPHLRERPDVPIVCADLGVRVYPATLEGAWVAPRSLGTPAVTLPFSSKQWSGASIAAARAVARIATLVQQGLDPRIATRQVCLPSTLF